MGPYTNVYSEDGFQKFISEETMGISCHEDGWGVGLRRGFVGFRVK